MKKTENVDLMLNLMKERGVPHPPHGEEREFYRLVAEGDTEGIGRLKEAYSGAAAADTEKGRLSDNPVRNEIYHLVANCTIITRKCIAAGMPQEDAYSLSDMFIRRADRCKSVEEVRAVNDEMAMEFAGRMKRIKARTVTPAVRKTISYISDNLHTRLTAGDIAGKMGYNRSYLAVLFRRDTGQTISDFVLRLRIETAKSLISGGVALSEVSGLVGFSSQSHFCRRFREVTGITPGEFRNNV